MENFKSMISSSTNWIIFIMIGFLCWLNFYTILHYPDTLFDKVFVVFTNVLTGFTGYKYGKSMPQQPVETKTEVKSSQDIVLEK